ncbi:DUF2125 domain-containing protein [Aureimonas sp. AU20]|uniref:DUF2125 domain-containing protein n=1 Tax=Aureimonas sp. AU20 TaxID=1349819 RepID=UPI0007205C44|nr:DUF2125 domain-containing protein [Aureimonas sp. AU20]ALN74373.1 hypothetical protein M673_16715 [Aureimonas sp. AU20]
MARSSSQAGAPRRSSAARALRGLIILVVILVALGAGGWYWLAGELDRRIASALEAAGGGGATVLCENRQVFGFPFRLGLSCDRIGVEAPQNGVSASAGSLRTAAQIYDPSHIVAELAGPALVTAPNLPPLHLSWRLMQGSTSLWTQGLERFSLVVEAPVVSVREGEGAGAPLARSERLEAHARQNGAALDLALTDAAVTATLPGLPELPPFDLAADLTLDGAAGWLRTGVPGANVSQALRGEAGTIRLLSLSLPGGGGAQLSGPFRVSQSGEVSGDFRLAVEDPQSIAGLIGVLVPGTGGLATTIAGALGFAGRQEDGKTVVDVQVREGEARLGFIPLGRIPRI